MIEKIKKKKIIEKNEKAIINDQTSFKINKKLKEENK